jgi:hypothetical protein
MDCRLSHLMLAFRRHELAAADAVALDAHLSACPACSALARGDSLFDSAVGRAMAAVPVPAGLRDSLLKSARASGGAAWRRTVTAWGGAALLLLVATAVGVGVYGHFTRTSFDTGSLVARHDRDSDLPGQATADWLRGEGLPETLPGQFDDRWVIFRGYEKLGGRAVPVVLFQNRFTGPDLCKVYVLREEQFRFDPHSLDPFEGSQFKVETVRQGKLVYVFVYTGPTLDPFRKRPTPNG